MGLPTPLDQEIPSAGPFSSTGAWAEAALACPDQPRHAANLRSGAGCDDRLALAVIAGAEVLRRTRSDVRVCAQGLMGAPGSWRCERRMA